MDCLVTENQWIFHMPQSHRLQFAIHSVSLASAEAVLWRHLFLSTRATSGCGRWEWNKSFQDTQGAQDTRLTTITNIKRNWLKQKQRKQQQEVRTETHPGMSLKYGGWDAGGEGGGHREKKRERSNGYKREEEGSRCLEKKTYMPCSPIGILETSSQTFT